MDKLTALLAEVTVEEGRQHGNMTVYPLRVPNGHSRGYVTLDEALRKKVIQVSEVDEGGHVPELRVKNQAEQAVLLVLGDELVGAKQNRTLNTSILVPAGADLNIPVSCVEQGRWSYRSRLFAGGSSSHASLRSMQMGTVTESLRDDLFYAADQGAVWGEVARSQSAHGAFSDTGAMSETYDHVSDRLEPMVEAFADLGDVQGALVTIDGEIVGLDLFDSADTLKALWPKLARSYALDALETPGETEAAAEPVPQTQIESFLQAASAATEESYESVGMGTDVRLTGDDVIGSALVWEDAIVHLSVFQNRGGRR